MMFLFFLLIPYIVVGLFTERHRYALANYNYSQLEYGHEFYVNAYNDAKAKRDEIVHKSYCYMSYSNLKSQGCHNCTDTNTANYNKYTRLMAEAKSGQTRHPAPSLRPGIIAGWPVYGTAVWLKSGTVEPSKMEVSNEVRIAQLEKELEITR